MWATPGAEDWPSCSVRDQFQCDETDLPGQAAHLVLAGNTTAVPLNSSLQLQCNKTGWAAVLPAGRQLEFSVECGPDGEVASVQWPR